MKFLFNCPQQRVLVPFLSINVPILPNYVLNTRNYEMPKPYKKVNVLCLIFSGGGGGAKNFARASCAEKKIHASGEIFVPFSLFCF